MGVTLLQVPPPGGCCHSDELPCMGGKLCGMFDKILQFPFGSIMHSLDSEKSSSHSPIRFDCSKFTARFATFTVIEERVGLLPSKYLIFHNGFVFAWHYYLPHFHFCMFNDPGCFGGSAHVMKPKHDESALQTCFLSGCEDCVAG